MPLRVAVAAALLASTSTGNAASFALLEQSSSRLGTAFAGTAAAADDATTIFFNPAGLMQLDDAQAIAGLAAVEITSEFHDEGSLPALGQPLGNLGGDAGDWNWVPSAYASMPIGKNMAIGIGVNAPFGLKLEYDEGWMGRFQALDSEIKTTNFNPTLAFRLGPNLSIGVGIDYQRVEAELTNAVNYTAVIAQGLQQLAANNQLNPAAIPGLIAANAGLEGHSRVRGDDDAWGFNIGIMLELGDATRIGLNYRSKIDYTVSGTVKFTSPVAPTAIGNGIIATATAAGGTLSDGDVSVALELPDSAILSLKQRLGEKFDLLADVAWTGWSSVQELRVVRSSGTTLSVTPERWSDSWRFALGGAYALSSKFTLRAGAAYDQTPVPDETRTPRLPDVDRTWLAVGARWQLGEHFGLDFGYAHLISDRVPLDQNAGNTNAYGRLVGEQSSDIDILTVQFRADF
jgi:long-chain fatty acid transport protein